MREVDRGMVKARRKEGKAQKTAKKYERQQESWKGNSCSNHRYALFCLCFILDLDFSKRHG